MSRFSNFIFAAFLIVILIVPIFLIGLLIFVSSKGPILFWSSRVGRNNSRFNMAKFRTMKLGTPISATHLLPDPGSHLTLVGGWLRKSSLDELPQLWNILIGDMNFVGPRPALYNQDDLIAMRTKLGVHQLTPGLTGWAQVNGRDELPIDEKVRLDFFYLLNKSPLLDFKILWLTILKVAKSDGISH